MQIFREQVPVTDPVRSGAVTYRTHRAEQLLQIWLLENRDYRSPTLTPDGPAKTLWGTRQREWLQTSLLASDATFKFYDEQGKLLHAVARQQPGIGR